MNSKTILNFNLYLQYNFVKLFLDFKFKLVYIVFIKAHNLILILCNKLDFYKNKKYKLASNYCLLIIAYFLD